MWPATKKILIAAAIGTLMGLTMGYATGLLLPMTASAITGLIPALTFPGAGAFDAGMVSLFFGISGGLMGAANKGLELATTSPVHVAAKDSGAIIKSIIHSKAPTLDAPSPTAPQPTSAIPPAPAASIQLAQYSGPVTTAELSQQIH